MAKGKQGKQRSAPVPHNHGRGRGGIVKNSHNSSSGALASAIAAARRGLGSSAPASSSSGSNLHLAHLSESAHAEEEATTEQILDFVRETAPSWQGQKLTLSELGDKVRPLAVRRGFHTALKQVRDKFGGWEVFLRTHAAGEFSVVQGMVQQIATDSTPMDEAAAATATARLAEPATSRDVNALSLDGTTL